MEFSLLGLEPLEVTIPTRFSEILFIGQKMESEHQRRLGHIHVIQKERERQTLRAPNFGEGCVCLAPKRSLTVYHKGWVETVSG